MIWLLPQSLKGKCSAPVAFWGVLMLGTLIVWLPFWAIIAAKVGPYAASASPFVVLPQWGYCMLAAIGLWNCAKNAQTRRGVVLARGVAVFYVLGPAYLVYLMALEQMAS